MKTRSTVINERDNPPIAQSMEDRVHNAFKYLEEFTAGLLSWSYEDIWKKAGIGKTTFFKYKKLFESGKSLDISPRGRKPILDANGIEKLREKVHTNALNLQAPKSAHEFGKLMQEIVEEVRDDDVEVTFTDQTRNNYKKLFKQVDNADVKSSSRRKAFLNMRNPLSLCAMLRMFQKRGVVGSLIYSCDDTSILLGNMDDKPTIILTEEAHQILAEINIAPSASVETEKRRVISVNCTIAGDGQCVCRVIKFADKNFAELCKHKDAKTGEEILKPFVCKLSGLDEKPLYIMLYLYGMDDTEVEKAMYRKCIFKSIVEHRQRYQQSILTGLEVLHSSQSTASHRAETGRTRSAVAEQTDAAILKEIEQSLIEGLDICDDVDGAIEEDEFLNGAEGTDDNRKDCEDWALLLQDGAYGQIQALTMKLAAEAKEKRIFLGKYAGGCSMTQSVNDVGNMHKVLKTMFKSSYFRYNDVAECNSRAWCELKSTLKKHMNSYASFKSVWKFFKFVDGFLQKAFCTQTVNSAFDSAGIVPFNPRRIMSKNMHYRELSRDRASIVLKLIDEFGAIFEEHGMIPENEFERLLGDLDNHIPSCGKPLNEMTVNRQRAVVLNETRTNNLVATRTAATKRKDYPGVGISSALKRVKRLNCRSGCCNEKFQDSDVIGPVAQNFQGCSSSSDRDPGRVWTKCNFKGCRFIFCPTERCQEIFKLHKDFMHELH